ncbi:MAG: hypothetical protein FWG88_08675 [Oscillospiraceae bacterium]|nr:hypothetical protein [Oscillospiraceae bacterium]
MRKKPFIAGLLVLVLAVAGYVIPRVMRTAIILEMGIIMANRLNLLFAPFAVFSFIALAFAFIPKKRKSKKKEPEYEIILPDLETLTPDSVREMLIHCKEKHPSLTEQYDDCIRQINIIIEQQESFEKLIALNNAGYLNEAISTLRLAEQTILRNLMTAVNRGIVEKTVGIIDSNEEIEFQNLLKRVLSANEDVFETNQRFLVRASTAISSKRLGNQSNTDTEAWIQALENLALPSKIFDEKTTQQPFQSTG